MIPIRMSSKKRRAYHFFSGMGLGTALTLQGKLGCPERFRPRIVPTRFRGRMTKKQMQHTATCKTHTEMQHIQTLLVYTINIRLAHAKTIYFTGLKGTSIKTATLETKADAVTVMIDLNYSASAK